MKGTFPDGEVKAQEDTETVAPKIVQKNYSDANLEDLIAPSITDVILGAIKSSGFALDSAKYYISNGKTRQ